MAAAVRGTRSGAATRRRDFLAALAFMAPALGFVGVLLLYPVAYNIYISFTAWSRFVGYNRLVGFANYLHALNDPNFSAAAQNTVVWVLASLVLPVTLGLALAVVLRGVRGEESLKTVFFLPRLIAPTAIGAIWYYVYAGNGVINTVLRSVGLGGLVRSWLYEPATITPAIIVTYVWQTTGLVMVLVLIGLAALPREPIEAAHVEGASPWQVYRYVILPMLFPTLLVVTIISVIAGFTTFDLVWVMGRDYPDPSTLTLAIHQYWESFRANHWAYGAAVAVILGGIALLITWLQVVLQHRYERTLQ
ncbi:MAG TPA: sugar ABC transporter permease [Acetobacteraceae bacterium]|nr:sugar ABC transporter permease [Acetobacteraceae bacterium]